ncbi:hypothetical protein OAF65_07670 [Verrucomicrobiales bacterium]|nr:hypothetical protein [Verrucomicrobiales bacterium]
MSGFSMNYNKIIYFFWFLLLFANCNAHSQLDRKDNAKLNSDLVFLWEGGKKNRESNKRIFNFRPVGSARYGNHFELDPGHGRFITKGLNLRDIISKKEWAMEIVMIPSDTNGKIISLPFAELTQKRNTLSLKSKYLARASEVQFDINRHDGPFHFVISSTPSGIEVYKNGELTKIIISVDKAPLSNELSGIVVGGDWFGRLYRLAVYSSLVDGKSLYKSAQSYLDSINPMIPSRKVRCQLKEKTRLPRVKDLGPYARCLVYNLYEVKQVLEGDLTVPDVIAVAHWAILDRNYVKDIPSQIDKEFDLIIEQYVLNPQLKSERQFNDISNFDAPLFYDVRVPEIKILK